MIESPGCLLSFTGAHKQYAENMSSSTSQTLPAIKCGVGGCDKVCKFSRDQVTEEVVPTYSDDLCKEQKKAKKITAKI